MSPIIDIQRRLHEAGRIRIGQQVPAKKRDGTPTTAPRKLDEFRFTSADGRALSAIAHEYGGAVEKWEGAPAGEQWQVFTQAREIAVLIPPENMSYSQYYETWSGGGCQRRCDGRWESIGETRCLCDPENRECKPHTRLSVMLAALPGTGLWRLDTQGWYAAVELGGALEMSALVSAASGRSILPGRLRLDQREVRRPGQPIRKFAVPILDLDVDMVALAGGQTAAIAGGRPALTPVPADSEPVPSLADQLAAVDTPAERAPRANAAEPIKRTGKSPKAAQTEEQPELAAGEKKEPLSEKLENGEFRINDSMKKRLFALMGEFGLTDRPARLAFYALHGGRDVTTTNDLSVPEGNKIMDKLSELIGAGESAAASF